MPIFNLLVGPEVPEDIQRARNEKKQARKDEQDAIEKKLAEEQENYSSSESSSEDDFGPSLPSSEKDVDEKSAIERLRRRATDDDKPPDRRNWLHTALGEEPGYDPKTFRRTQNIMGEGMSETNSARTKRMADEMMGLSGSNTNKIADTVDNSSQAREQASLLDDHMKRFKSSSKNQKLSSFLDSAKSMNDRFQKK